jgi:flavin reductase (DIM6/NTAB) family NADH-FMN oxidoreductase RutF
VTSVDHEFARLLGRLDYPMFVVTASDGRDRDGCLVGFASQVSIHPPRFLVCLSDKNRTYRVAQNAQTLMVHLVGRSQERLARLFGGETGDQVDKFAYCEWAEGPGGAPALLELPNRFAGRILERLPFGDHVGFWLEPIEVHSGESEPTLTFRQVKGMDPGHAP